MLNDIIKVALVLVCSLGTYAWINVAWLWRGDGWPGVALLVWLPLCWASLTLCWPRQRVRVRLGGWTVGSTLVGPKGKIRITGFDRTADVWHVFHVTRNRSMDMSSMDIMDGGYE